MLSQGFLSIFARAANTPLVRNNKKMRDLSIYNTLSRKKELFVPLHAPNVGMYVCGPTVYGDPHLGHARSAITFDVLFRLLNTLGYKVRYVRNITDVGHLQHDADEGEDKIAARARLEALEPMEIAQKYTNRYHDMMRELNVLPPSIEPLASGHIIEQIALIEQILKAGYAYESEGNVYFDIERYEQSHHYGILSGRVLDDLQNNTRTLDGQESKRNPLDFALWKRATPQHIMRWPSPWGEGFPGWHLECSAMGMKYLGQEFDIHGGGMDLLFPHHECEIAQCVAAKGSPSVRYWMHNNMVTRNGQKMGKSLGNFITLEELFSGKHASLDQAYSPMTVRFFILQAHYRSTLDFSNEALQAAGKGLERLLATWHSLERVQAGTHSTFSVEALENKCFDALCDDLNTPIALATLFDAGHQIGRMEHGDAQLTAEDLERLRRLFNTVLGEILGLRTDNHQNTTSSTALDTAMRLLLECRADAKARKDYTTSDRIRDQLKEAGVEIQDHKDGSTYSVK